MASLKIFRCMLAAVIALGCNTKKQVITDLAFFNLRGKVKSYSEIKSLVLGNLDSTVNFDFYKDTEEYLKLCFSETGELTSVNIAGPTIYHTVNAISRGENTLSIKVDAVSTILYIKFTRNGDTLSMEQFTPSPMNGMDDLYRKYVYVKKGKGFLMSGFIEGKSPSNLCSNDHLTAIPNYMGHDSVVYLVRKDNRADTIPAYQFTYPEYDKYGNWLRKKNQSGRFISTGNMVFRKIEYYE